MKTTIEHKYDINETVWIPSSKEKESYYCKRCGQQHTTNKRVPIKTRVTSISFNIYSGNDYTLNYYLKNDEHYCFYNENIIFKTRKECQNYIDDNYEE